MRGETIATESNIRDPDLSTRIGETVAAEFLGLTCEELLPEAGEGPLVCTAFLSGVLPVLPPAAALALPPAALVALEFVGVFVAERLFKAMSLALTASK